MLPLLGRYRSGATLPVEWLPASPVAPRRRRRAYLPRREATVTRPSSPSPRAPFPRAPGSGVERLLAEGSGIFQPAPDRAEEARAELAVDHPVVGRQGELHDAPNGEPALDDDRGGDRARDRQDRGLAGVDDRAELVDPEHAEVGHGAVSYT